MPSRITGRKPRKAFDEDALVSTLKAKTPAEIKQWLDDLSPDDQRHVLAVLISVVLTLRDG